MAATPKLIHPDWVPALRVVPDGMAYTTIEVIRRSAKPTSFDSSNNPIYTPSTIVASAKARYQPIRLYGTFKAEPEIGAVRHVQFQVQFQDDLEDIEFGDIIRITALDSVRAKDKIIQDYDYLVFDVLSSDLDFEKTIMTKIDIKKKNV